MSVRSGFALYPGQGEAIYEKGSPTIKTSRNLIGTIRTVLMTKKRAHIDL